MNGNGVKQREALLDELRKRPLTTYEIRKELDIMQAQARIFDLRELGYNVQTHWTEEQSDSGDIHRIAKYVLLPGKGCHPHRRNGGGHPANPPATKPTEE